MRAGARQNPPYAKNRKVLHTVRIRWFAGVAAGCERERERERDERERSCAAIERSMDRTNKLRLSVICHRGGNNQPSLLCSHFLRGDSLASFRPKQHHSTTRTSAKQALTFLRLRQHGAARVLLCSPEQGGLRSAPFGVHPATRSKISWRITRRIIRRKSTIATVQPDAH